MLVSKMDNLRSVLHIGNVKMKQVQKIQLFMQSNNRTEK